MNNSIEIIKSFMNGKGNPQQLITKIMGSNNALFNNLIFMANRGDRQSIENFARNYCKERNVDFDKEFANFMNNFK